MPAFNEEAAIAFAVASVPEYVDRVIVVDDASRDETGVIARRADPRLELIRHGANRGVGAAIVTGYQRALALDLDVAVVMAGDGQMDPRDLPGLLDPIVAGRADYAKGNRFRHPEIWTAMPPVRLVGNTVLSLATRLTSGYRDIFDSQCGYTAIHRRALEAIDLEHLFPRYGYPNDLLARLRSADMRVVDVPVRPVYGAGWRSGVRWHTALYPVSYVLLRSWWNRALARRAPRVTGSADSSRLGNAADASRASGRV